MNLNEFRQRWVDDENLGVESSIDDSGTEGGDDWRWPIKKSTVRQPVRLRPKYVPEADGDVGGGWLRRAALCALIVVLVFIVALIVLGAALNYLPTYLTTYVFDR